MGEPADKDEKPFSSAAAIKEMGAPNWAVVAEAANIARHKGISRTVTDLSGRVTNLEGAVVAGAAKSGAAAGRTHGAFWGAFLAAMVSGLTTCDAPRTDTQPTKDVPAMNGGASNQ